MSWCGGRKSYKDFHVLPLRPHAISRRYSIPTDRQTTTGLLLSNSVKFQSRVERDASRRSLFPMGIYVLGEELLGEE